jgi:hypothetical protein
MTLTVIQHLIEDNHVKIIAAGPEAFFKARHRLRGEAAGWSAGTLLYRCCMLSEHEAAPVE